VKPRHEDYFPMSRYNLLHELIEAREEIEKLQKRVGALQESLAALSAELVRRSEAEAKGK
jgi:hypothetical protein